SRDPPSSSSRRSSATCWPRPVAAESRRSSGLRIHRARSGHGVELVRVVEDCGLRRLRGRRVMVGTHRVQQLGQEGAVESLGALLDEAQAEVDVAEELALGSREEERAAVELPHPAGVVEKRGGKEEVRAQALVQLWGVPGPR